MSEFGGATGEDDSADVRTVPQSRLLLYLLGLGTWGFGGPIASVGYMQRDLVERRKWMSRRDFLHGVALGQTMPGPLAAQVVMWIGFLRAGAVGALTAALAFILPSFTLVLTVAVVYSHYSSSAVVQALFAGIAPVVMAIIAIAAYKIARTTDRNDWRLWAITASLAVITAVTGAELAVLFIGAGLLMVLVEAPPTRWRRRPSALAVLPVASPAKIALAGSALLPLGWFFLKAGAFIFGSGLAIVPFLRAGVVQQHHWLTSGQFLDAVAMGLITPGPVVITATFIGYLVHGLLGAINRSRRRRDSRGRRCTDPTNSPRRRGRRHSGHHPADTAQNEGQRTGIDRRRCAHRTSPPLALVTRAPEDRQTHSSSAGRAHNRRARALPHDTVIGVIAAN